MDMISQTERASDLDRSRGVESGPRVVSGDASTEVQVKPVVVSESGVVSAAVAAFEASHQLRLVIRGTIAVLCVAAVFLFLYFPDHSGVATFPLPMLVIAFALLRFFAKVLHLVIDTASRSGRAGSSQTKASRATSRAAASHWSVALAASASDYLFKALIAFVLSMTVVVGATYEIPLLGIVAALTLLVATLVNRPCRGLFPDASQEEQRDRVRRQTRESLACAALESQYVPAASFQRRELRRDPPHSPASENTPPQDTAEQEVYIEFDETDDDAFDGAYHDDSLADASAQLRVITERVG
ncbi:hypothetical protein NZK35_31525 [Stieleria sp. ICT_E10.1]|uniref:hypothetical protein n=1 Tax=Stieleria sedimenti TaxID=2976331 RepID=UPI00217F8B6A|nr:hypothetical protein [Stieleria sedimenti]MCS7471211.1 hypothetical protein [Stieleria sedimenti]